jgi:hypothetical protein
MMQKITAAIFIHRPAVAVNLETLHSTVTEAPIMACSCSPQLAGQQQTALQVTISTRVPPRHL